MKLKTFGDKTEADIRKRTMLKEILLSKNFSAILNVKLTIPIVAASPAAYKTHNFVPKIENKTALII